jgi:hypothetical protein
MGENSMKQEQHEKIFFNRAGVKSAEQIHCESCFEQVVFTLRDNHSEFSLGLSTVFECLAFAIGNNDLPKLPSSWCASVESTFGRDFFGEGARYNDYSNAPDASS